MQKYSLVIHGGAGTILKEDMTPELEKAYIAALEDSLQAGFSVLEAGGTAVDAINAALVVMEDNILFNAGRGSVFTKKGLQEMDAAIMDGNTMMAGAVAGVRNIKNPIVLAKEVMLHSNHVFLSGKGANDFALKQRVQMEPDEYFFSQFRYDQWKEIRDTDQYSLDHTNKDTELLMRDKKFGTIGAVAKDAAGNIAAGTSTGGMTNKKYGRIGDSPVIGGGTYASNKTCAISCTGHGEPFMKAVAAYDVAARMEYKGLSISDAMNEVVHKKLIDMQGEGGMIGVDAEGNTAMMFNSAGMYRAMQNSSGEKVIGIYKD